MEMLLGRTDDRFGLIIHIGCGDSAGRLWQDRADTVILVEPDPERALALKTWLEGGGKGTLVEAAVADRSGEGIFRRTSFDAMNSLRAPTGAKELFPGLQSLETVPVNLVRPRDLLSGRALENTRGRIGLVVDAPSETLLVLADLDDAGVLEQFDDIAVRVAERPLHEGGADRKDLEAWLKDTGRCLAWEPNPDDPDIRYAIVETDWRARNSQNERRVLELEEEIESVRQSYASASEEAQANFTALDKAKQDREALKAEVEELKTALSKASEEIEGLHKLRSELEALREDNRLLLRIQRIAQADLADLQNHYASLSREKLELEHFIDTLAEKVRQSIDIKKSLASKKNTKGTRSRAQPSGKPARKTSRAQSS